MSRFGKSFLVLVVFAAAGLAMNTPAQVVINEIHYNPPGTDGSVLLEFIELHNRGASAADISNWRLTFGALPFVFPASVSIPAGGYVVVAENPASLNAAKGYLTPFSWAGLGVGLDNGGELITLENAALVGQDSVLYDDVAPWPAGSGPGQPDDGGSSIELLNPALDNNVGGSWRASTVVNGTPGAQNSVYSNAPTVQAESPARRTAVANLATVSVTFSASVTGVTADALTVEGSAAASVACPSCSGGAGAGPYTFSGYTAPAPGSVTVALVPAGIAAGGVPFAGDSWTVSTGIVAVINELHYHPLDPDADAEFLEVFNAGSAVIDMSGWTFSAGLTGTVPNGTFVPVGAYVVFAKNPSLVQARTGYAAAIAWESGSLSNGGEPIAISDAANNVIDSVTYSDSGAWPSPPDGDGPSAELINPAMPNQYGGSWRPSVANWGTPGAQNSTYIAAPPPIINNPTHTPLLPLPNQAITVTALILDDGVGPPAVTLYYRQDQDPTIAYSSTPMLDDGAHGDGAAGDGTFGATVPGLADGQRLDFTIRADDGTNVSAGPSGHNTLVAGQYPAQTYLCKFSNPPTSTDLPHYHLITTQRTRSLQDAHNENEYDGTFVHCNAGSSGCVLFYNVVERYRGQSSLNQHPHSFRVGFSAAAPLQSEMGFPLKKLNVMSQQPDRQGLGYQFFREAFNHGIPTHMNQFVRFLTNPVSHGGAQELVYNNAEAEDVDFTESEGGLITPLRWPGVCTVSLVTCSDTTDCGGVGDTCFNRTTGNLYKGVLNADLQYRGTDENSYRANYEKQTNETEDDFTDVVALTFATDPDTTSDANYESAMNAMVDEEEWARFFATHMLLGNDEGGIYRDTGDDYLIYIEPPASPLGPNVKLLPRDMDSTFGGFGTFNQETIWRTNIQASQRFIRNNAYAGRFVDAICDLLDTDFTPAVMNPRIDALPNAVADAAKKTQFKNWVAARITFVNNEIVRQTTLTGVPPSPYQNPSAVLSLSGQLNQRGTHHVLLNGALVSNFSVYGHTWSASYTLVPGPNQITVQSVDVNGVVLDQATASVAYNPPGSCTTSADCSDGNACTTDVCGATGNCEASLPADCNDNDACTTDSCDPLLGCQHAAANCDDSNVCTDDSCNISTGCVHVNNTASCSDGSFCTVSDVCSGGTCGGTAVVCPGGQTCNPDTGICQSGPITLTFQQGASGYTGSADTYIDSALGSQAGVSPIVIDGSPVDQVLLKFDGIFGAGPGQIPAGSTITSATLTLWVGANANDQSADTVTLHRLLHAWNATDVWNAYGVAPWNAQGGIQNDGVDAVAAASATASMNALATSYPVNVTTSLQAWAANPSSNFGWAILPPPAGTDGLRLESAESVTASSTRRPLLSVTFNAPSTGCTTDPDCNDNNACNGLETCVANLCQAGTAPNCDDGNVCTTDSCVPATGCAHANNTASCSDGNACTANDTCASGTCVAGAPPNCDDANVCTDDSCNTATGCVHANNTGSCSDGNLCTTGDACSGGTCSGAPLSCPVGQTCNPTSGACESAPVTVSFQDGVGGYGGTQDTYLAQNAPATVEGALDNWRWDTENPAPNAEFGLIRFDNLFGSGPGQIPIGSTIQSANLVLELTNGSVAPNGSVNESTVDWAEATATWSNFGGDAGVQADEYLASPQYVAPIATGSATISVTASVQAWSSGTRTNLGWVFRPANNDGVQVDSAEFATIALRPKLTVVYVAGCSTDAHCDDGNVCNGLETCVTGQCQAGTPPNCTDSNVCTTDSCDPVNGCQHIAGPDGTSCSDGDTCTADDTCQSGACTGGVQLQIPGEVTNVMFGADQSTIVWDSAIAAGSGTVHDVLRGLVSQLPVSTGAAEDCFASGIAAATVSDTATPPIMDSYWYLVRGKNACGTGTYGFSGIAGAAGAERTSNACP